jgi:hypothetical protein
MLPVVLLADATWNDITELRARVDTGGGDALEVAAARFAAAFTEQFETIVLSRVFVVVPFADLPSVEQAVAQEFVRADSRLQPRTPVLSLMGTSGRGSGWNDRLRSRGHRTIPLLDREFVRGAPMIAKLLADLEIDLAALDTGISIVTRRMLGGANAAFFVPDAPNARDDSGRPIIPSQDFVRASTRSRPSSVWAALT